MGCCWQTQQSCVFHLSWSTGVVRDGFLASLGFIFYLNLLSQCLTVLAICCHSCQFQLKGESSDLFCVETEIVFNGHFNWNHWLHSFHSVIVFNQFLTNSCLHWLENNFNISSLFREHSLEPVFMRVLTDYFESSHNKVLMIKSF